MAHWLMKTEPHDYSWDRLGAEGETSGGVRNHQAAANMRAMKLGEPGVLLSVGGRARDRRGHGGVRRIRQPDSWTPAASSCVSW